MASKKRTHVHTQDSILKRARKLHEEAKSSKVSDIDAEILREQATATQRGPVTLYLDLVIYKRLRAKAESLNVAPSKIVERLMSSYLSGAE